MKRIKLKPSKVVQKPKDNYLQVYVGKMCVGDYFFIEPKHRVRKNDSYYWEQYYFAGSPTVVSGFCKTDTAAVEAILKSIRDYIRTNTELINKIVE